MRKVVLITGASRGIGRETARVFARHGYDVVINYYKSRDEALALKHELEEENKIKCLEYQASVNDVLEVDKMITKAMEVFGRIDVVVNNAGIAIDTVFEDKTRDNFLEILDVNLIGTFLVSKIASKYMTSLGGGAIINVSSTNGIDTNYPYSMDYDASKAGVISLTRNLAWELAPNIRVNAVAPGWVDTDMNRDLDIEYRNQEEEKILLGRFAHGSEIAKVIYFLATDDASYINGEVIRVDGGCR